MPPADILKRIVAARRQRLGMSRPPEAPPRLFSERISSREATGSNAFAVALRERQGRAVIAEIKLGSPRLGSLVDRIDPEKQAVAYREHGATALSVVVEPDFFYGSYALLARCRVACGLPAIAKDFLVSERQLDEAAEVGADAFLLIAALHSADELAGWAEAVRNRGMAPLVETHDAHDLAKVVESQPWEMVGINNRDLTTFDVSLATSIALRPRIPTESIAIAESGISSRADIERLRAGGFDAFLVGECLLLADDPGAKLAELVA